MRAPKELANMHIKDLEKHLDSLPYGHMERDLAFQELTRRRLQAISKRQTVITGIWIAFLAALLAAIAAGPVIREFFQASPFWGKAASSPSHPSKPPE